MFRKFNPMTILCALFAAILLTTGAAFAQSQATTGNIEGRVIDPNGAAVPGVGYDDFRHAAAGTACS